MRLGVTPSAFRVRPGIRSAVHVGTDGASNSGSTVGGGAFMKTWVTGGAGFLGSHMAEALIAGGHSVTVIDDFSTGHLLNLEMPRQKSLGTVPRHNSFSASTVPHACGMGVRHRCRCRQVRQPVRRAEYERRQRWFLLGRASPRRRHLAMAHGGRPCPYRRILDLGSRTCARKD